MSMRSQKVPIIDVSNDTDVPKCKPHIDTVPNVIVDDNIDPDDIANDQIVDAAVIQTK